METYLDRTSVPIDGMRFEASLAAMQGILANGAVVNSAAHVADQAVKYADALINRLTVPKEETI